MNSHAFRNTSSYNLTYKFVICTCTPLLKKREREKQPIIVSVIRSTASDPFVTWVNTLYQMLHGNLVLLVSGSPREVRANISSSEHNRRGW